MLAGPASLLVSTDATRAEPAGPVELGGLVLGPDEAVLLRLP